MTFQNELSYDLNDLDLQYFITNTQIAREINNLDTIYSFLDDMNYNINYGDNKSTRYYFIEELYSRYQQSHWGNTIDDIQLGSGLQSYTQNYAGSGLQGYTQSHIVCLPSDPDELVDQLKLLTLF